jgi:hypothetical protein
MTTPADPHGIQPPPDPAAGHGAHVTAGAHDHHHHAAPAGEAWYFTDEEWNQFRKSDAGAAAAIAGLMASIFTIGLLLYTAIAIVVANWA